MEESANRKIDFLMRVTGTQNAVLAHALNFDASYISRIRNGQRGLPPKQPFIKPASEFFARNIREPYQREALANALQLDEPWPADTRQAARLLAAWLGGSPKTAFDANRGGLPDDRVAISGSLSDNVTQVQLFFGEDGKRDGACTFLSELVAAEYRGTILLQSDEDLNWMYDKGFLSEWAALMRRIAGNKCTVKVVHTMSRNAGEMWEGVRAWLPLYNAGFIEPYYYPRLRDGIRGRSLYVAPGFSALISNSVQGMQGDAMCMLIRDDAAVDAVTREFDAYLALCSPLATLSALDSAEFNEFLESLLAQPDKLAAAANGDIAACAVEGVGAIVVSCASPETAFLVEELRLVNAIADYLRTLDPGPVDLDAMCAWFQRRSANAD